MSKFWFEFTKDVVPNHMISVDAKDNAGVLQSGQIQRKQHALQEA